MSKKVISYCIYGNNPKYTTGIIEAVISSNLIYLDWEVWVYYSKKSVPSKIVDMLRNLNCTLIPYEDDLFSNDDHSEGMFRRFQPLSNENVGVWISRDADSRCTKRERMMVEEWLQSGKAIHSILDHPCHKSLMGGTIGVSNTILKQKYPDKIVDIDDVLKSYAESHDNKMNKYNMDQLWIRDHFKSIVLTEKDILVHVNERSVCIRDCSMYGLSPINEHFVTILVSDCDNFCGKPIHANERCISINIKI
jgi:hypothetical protein